MNILIVKLSAIGDVIHTMPALVALRRRWPEAHISWLVEEAGAELLEDHGALSDVIVWRRRVFQEDFRKGRWMRACGACCTRFPLKIQNILHERSTFSFLIIHPTL